MRRHIADWVWITFYMMHSMIWRYIIVCNLIIFPNCTKNFGHKLTARLTSDNRICQATKMLKAMPMKPWNNAAKSST